jgi:deoxyribodipyrimidine photo-lyase
MPAAAARDGNNTGLDGWRRWVAGKTGLPLVDAAMRELAATGYTSNRCRQNAVSLLVNDLKIDWRLGAEWFQWCLVDHDVSANWGNWAYFSGVGFDPKARYFRTLSQAKKHDPRAEFIQLWCEELRACETAAEALWPFEGTVAGWPTPVVAPREHLAWQDRQALDEKGEPEEAEENEEEKNVVVAVVVEESAGGSS